MLTATCIKIKDAQPLGPYTRTAIDDKKDAATLLLQQVCPTVVFSRVPLSGKGITEINVTTGTNPLRTYRLTDRAWDTLKKLHSWATDF